MRMCGLLLWPYKSGRNKGVVVLMGCSYGGVPLKIQFMFIVLTRIGICITISGQLYHILKLVLKPWPNDRNISTQHIATMLGASCYVRLATMLRRVATCWLLLAQI